MVFNYPCWMKLLFSFFAFIGFATGCSKTPVYMVNLHPVPFHTQKGKLNGQEYTSSQYRMH